MTTGTMDFITSSGRMTPMEAMPTPDLAVPYAAPKHEKTIEAIAPMNPKKGAIASPSAACTPVTHAARHAKRRATLVLVFIIARVFSLLVRLAL